MIGIESKADEWIIGTAIAVALVVAGPLACKEDEGESKPIQEPPARQQAADPAAPQPAAKPVALAAEAISKAAGTEASETDGVVRIGWSRSEVSVTIDGDQFPPAAGLGSWAAFMATDEGAMVMGDTVVFEDEINPAIDAAFAHGLEITALHNHFIFDEPPVYFMHIGGRGDAEKLAGGVKAMWDAIEAVRAKNPMPVRSSGGPKVQPGKLDSEALQAILGQPLQDKPGGVLKAVFPREASMKGMSFDGKMGLTTWAAFVGDDELASIDGDFAMTADEVQPVLRALREGGIEIAALHNHMIGEKPAYFFVHFWAKGKPVELAEAFRSALEAQK